MTAEYDGSVQRWVMEEWCAIEHGVGTKPVSDPTFLRSSLARGKKDFTDIAVRKRPRGGSTLPDFGEI